VDDPVKNRAEAESPTMRERAWAFYQNDCVTRLEPGASFLCIQTRWHEDDLAGRLTKANPDEDWEGLEYINIPAIQDEGVEGQEKALWPEGGWDLPALYRRRQRVGAYAWASLFQGHPVPRGSTVFGPPTFFSELPTSYRVGHGIDLAYTEKTSADFSVVVTMFASKVAVRTALDPTERVEDWFYVRHVRRRQVRAPEFRNELRMEYSEFKGEMRIYAAGTETGAADFMREDRVENGRVVEKGLPIEVVPAKGDKFTRAIDFAAAWNAGRVLVPAPELIEGDPIEYDWVHDYLDIIRSFTGVNDAHDDDVDASAAAYDLLAESPVAYPTRSNPTTRRV
jgi:predicted phage terminase large subunit-like protein